MRNSCVKGTPARVVFFNHFTKGRSPRFTKMTKPVIMIAKIQAPLPAINPTAAEHHKSRGAQGHQRICAQTRHTLAHLTLGPDQRPAEHGQSQVQSGKFNSYGQTHLSYSGVRMTQTERSSYFCYKTFTIAEA
jgi:hypothetical protein